MKVVVFTDLDATLLDSETYSWSAAEEALDALRKKQAAVILVSSKTFAEMEPLHRQLGFQSPFVIENGGAIVFGLDTRLIPYLQSMDEFSQVSKRGDFRLVPVGRDYKYIVEALETIAARVNCSLVGFSSMSDSEVSRLTGLDLEEAARARQRDFCEPFVVPSGASNLEDKIQAVAAEMGLTVVQGGRFWHLMGHAGKRKAVSALIDAYRKLYGDVLTIGLGDSPNDFPFLELVDIPVLVRDPDDGFVLPPSLPRARRTSRPGPEGWNSAVLAILAEFDKGDWESLSTWDG